jgi:phage terminase large subunit-like protein
LPLLPVLYEFPEGIDWRDPANWHMVTPNNGRSITVERLIPDYETAKEAGEEELRRWASQHLNIEIGLALRSDRWAGADFWEGAAEPGLTLESILERSEVVCIGVDGGGLDDLLAISVLGREKVTRRWLHWGRAWAHNFVLERRKSEAPRLRDLEKTGDLEIVDEMEAAFLAVADIAAQVDAAGLLHAVGLDPMGVGAIVDALALRGIEGDDRVVGVSQGWTLTGAVKTGEVNSPTAAFALRPGIDGVGRRELQGRAARKRRRHHEAIGRQCQDRPGDGDVRLDPAYEPEPRGDGAERLRNKELLVL